MDYEERIIEASLYHNREGDKIIDSIAEDVNEDETLTEKEKEDLWDFADNHKVQD